MNRSILLLAGSTLIFGSASAYFLQQERAGLERNAALEARVKELESALAATQSPPPPPATVAMVEEPPAPIGIPKQPAKAPASPTTKAAAVAGAVRATANGFIAGPSPAFRSMRMDKLMEDPEYRAAMRSQQRMMMSSRYPDLGEALHLQPEQLDKLMDLLTDQEMDSISSGQASFREGGQADPAGIPEWVRKAQQRQRDNEAQLAGLLGDSGLQEWKEYQQTLGARMQVKQLRGIMEGSSDPIRPDQVQSLVDAMAAEQQRVMQTQLRDLNGTRGVQRPVMMLNGAGAMRLITPGNQVAMMEKSLEQTEQNNQRMHDAVAPYLSQRQLEQFDRYQTQQLEFQRASLRMMRASAEAEARGEVQPNGTSISVNSALVPMGITTP